LGGGAQDDLGNLEGAEEDAVLASIIAWAFAEREAPDLGYRARGAGAVSCLTTTSTLIGSEEVAGGAGEELESSDMLGNMAMAGASSGWAMDAAVFRRPSVV